MLIATVPCLFALAGLVVYLLCTPGPTPPKLAELGRVTFAMALLVALLEVGRAAAHVFP